MRTSKKQKQAKSECDWVGCRQCLSPANQVLAFFSPSGEQAYVDSPLTALLAAFKYISRIS